MKPDDPRIMSLQGILGRTHKGRVIHDDALKVLETADPNTDRGMVECPNCGFVAGEELFINGCPNCHSREAINAGEQR
jgi:Zn finger protein HypA/HybF involved in hydrogenase expression